MVSGSLGYTALFSYDFFDRPVCTVMWRLPQERLNYGTENKMK
jgi:hypothetical protein